MSMSKIDLNHSTSVKNKMVTYLLVLFAKAIRPLSRHRGAGRLCQFLNSLFLAVGAVPKQMVNMRDGTKMYVDLRSHTERYSFYSGSYDDNLIDVAKAIMSCGGNFLDVGGNVGMYSVRVGHCLTEKQKVFCVEPMPENVKRIRENIFINGLYEKVQIFENAFTDVNSVVTLVLREDFENGSQTGNASIAISDDADCGFNKIVVKGVRLDDVYDLWKISDVRLIKVDIEGHEDMFFSGARNFLLINKPVILTEVNNWYYKKKGTTIDSAFRSVLPSEYNFFAITQIGQSFELTRVESLNEFQGVHNVLLIPDSCQKMVIEVLALKLQYINLTINTPKAGSLAAS